MSWRGPSFPALLLPEVVGGEAADVEAAEQVRTRTTASNSSGVIWWKMRSRRIPALFTTDPSARKLSRAACTMRWALLRFPPHCRGADHSLPTRCQDLGHSRSAGRFEPDSPLTLTPGR